MELILTSYFLLSVLRSGPIAGLYPILERSRSSQPLTVMTFVIKAPVNEIIPRYYPSRLIFSPMLKRDRCIKFIHIY